VAQGSDTEGAIKQAVLLAAGTGSRLLPLTADRPKCMVEIAGRAIVDTLLDALGDLQIEEVIVVTGYKEESLRHYLEAKGGFRWRFIHNERYATTNNILSLQVACDAITAPFLLVESDIYLTKKVLEPLREVDQILVAPYTAEMDGTGITIGEGGVAEEMVIRAHLARPDDLPKMHKTVNFYSFSIDTWSAYREALNRWVAEGQLDQYYEAVLAELINNKTVEMQGADVGLDGWAEVDDAKDLAALEAKLALS
jgi:choline kinase